jgi:RimJ/RimL family protein N-acetyltransferase
MSRPLAHTPTPPPDLTARPLHPHDAPALASLLLDAYRGTIDDQGEGPDEAAAEIARLLDGAYGTPNHAASQLFDRDGVPVSATLITHHDGAPLLAFSVTAPAWQRRGLARAGLLRAMATLRDQGHTTLRLVVTCGNTPAEALYASLGFTPDPPRIPL